MLCQFNRSARFCLLHGAVGLGSLTSFSYPGQTNTYFSSSSTSGLVAGNYAGNGGFIWTGGSSFTDVVYPGAHGQTYTYGVNDAGDMAGVNNCCGLGLAFLDKGGVATTILIPGEPGNEILPYAVNNSDVVVGEGFDGAFQNGFIWHSGVSSVLNFPGARVSGTGDPRSNAGVEPRRNRGRCGGARVQARRDRKGN